MNDWPASPGDAEVQRRLAETIAWIESRRGIVCDPLSTPDLRPSRPFVHQRETPAGTFEYDQLDTAGRIATVNEVAGKRAGLLARENIVTDGTPGDLARGRLLAFACDWSIWDGLSENESEGLVDVYDIPAWDTWVHLFPGERTDVLLCWVPPEWIGAAHAAIAVYCTGCLYWWDESPDR